MSEWAGVFCIASWLAGIALSSGFWSGLAAIIFPPWAWYLLVEHTMTMFNFV